jgi:hypothetical protein
MTNNNDPKKKKKKKTNKQQFLLRVGRWASAGRSGGRAPADPEDAFQYTRAQLVKIDTT